MSVCLCASFLYLYNSLNKWPPLRYFVLLFFSTTRCMRIIAVSKKNRDSNKIPKKKITIFLSVVLCRLYLFLATRASFTLSALLGVSFRTLFSVFLGLTRKFQNNWLAHGVTFKALGSTQHSIRITKLDGKFNRNKLSLGTLASNETLNDTNKKKNTFFSFLSASCNTTIKFPDEEFKFLLYHLNSD